MPSKAQVEEWRDGFARVAPCDMLTNGDFQAIADMLEWAADIIDMAGMYVAGEGPEDEYYAELDAWLVEWFGKGGDDA